ncbi:MAG TPA: copper-binding protein [Hyphomicrobiaceae bacterium]|jgi:hypothetical protein|nr:copper-binding protein [Hyphomicrobiaceae bacterium]
MNRLPTLILATALAAPSLAHADGYLALKPERLPDLEIGLGEAGYGVSQKEYTLSTGKAYRLKLKSTGQKECAWIAPEFSNFIWLRKIEVGHVEIKPSHVYEIEMEREGEAEIFFVPIRPGEYAWGCRGLEGKGLAGKFIVK